MRLLLSLLVASMLAAGCGPSSPDASPAPEEPEERALYIAEQFESTAVQPLLVELGEPPALLVLDVGPRLLLGVATTVGPRSRMETVVTISAPGDGWTAAEVRYDTLSFASDDAAHLTSGDLALRPGSLARARTREGGGFVLTPLSPDEIDQLPGPEALREALRERLRDPGTPTTVPATPQGRAQASHRPYAGPRPAQGAPPASHSAGA